MTKLKKSNCEKNQKILLGKTQIVTLVIVTVVSVAVLTVVIVTSFSQNNLKPQQPFKFFHGIYSQFFGFFF